MKYILLILCTFLTLNAYSQIKTPSFVKYNRCPFDFSQISFSVGWRQPTSGTCDYFNRCCSNAIASVPQNYFGYQDNGIHAYAGLYTVASADYREYIGTAIPALIPGNTYTVSMSVSLADSCNIATDGLGILFTTYPYAQPILTVIPIPPQIDYSSYGTIKDKVNWVTLTGAFVADSAYTNLIAGSFKSSNTMMDTVGPLVTKLNYSSYYYIQEIGLADSTYFGDSTYAPTDTVIQTEPPAPDTADYVFPNAFTPNRDGTNDVFRIKGKVSNNYGGYTLRVYNRWGECVFMTHFPDEGWDGTRHGEPQSTAVYFYFAEFVLDGKRILAKGDVTLMR